MVVKFEVRGDMRRVIADMERERRDVRSVALPRALNKMADQVKNSAARAMRDTGYNIKVSDIKKGLRVLKATADNPTAVVIASGRPIPLIAFGARQTRVGVSVRVLHGRSMIPNVFIATMPNGHKGVFERLRDTHKKTYKNGRIMWSGLPIHELFGPSIPDGLANEAVRNALEQLVRDKFPTILRQQIERLK